MDKQEKTAAKNASDRVHNKPGPGTEGPEHSHAGLDTQGNFRFGAKYSVQVKGDGLVVTEANSGTQVDVSEATMEGLIKEAFFTSPIKK